MSETPPRKKRVKTPSPYVIEVDRPRCTGIGACFDHAARTFDLDDDAVAIVIDPDGDSGEKQLAAAQSCPRDAILLYLRGGDPPDPAIKGEKVWPE